MGEHGASNGVPAAEKRIVNAAGHHGGAGQVDRHQVGELVDLRRLVPHPQRDAAHGCRRHAQVLGDSVERDGPLPNEPCSQCSIRTSKVCTGRAYPRRGGTNEAARLAQWRVLAFWKHKSRGVLKFRIKLSHPLHVASTVI